MPPGEHVSHTKVGGIDFMIHKDNGKFVVYIDGDKLDTYNSKADAEKFGNQFIKQYKGMK
jgi:hypothetical protein